MAGSYCESLPSTTGYLLLPLHIHTGARWPNFRPNNSKEAPKIAHGRKKLKAVKWQNLAKSSRKEAGKYFYKNLGEKPYDIL
jgi:hypothetical protein